MKILTWWFRIVGLVYLVLGATWLPFLDAKALDSKIPNFDGPAGGTAYNGFLDWMLVFALDMLVTGVFLIVASFRPAWQPGIVWLIVGLEVVRGILDDLYMIAAGYPVASNIGFIVLHLAIIATGLVFARSSSRVGAGQPKAVPAA